MSTARPRTAPNKFVVRREATRADLIRLGIERFRIKGYSGTTIDDIVRDSPHTRGAFYFHFTGKEQFFVEVLRARAAMRDEWWTVVRDPAIADLPSAIVAALERLAGYEDDPGTWLLPVADFFQSVRTDESATRALRELYEGWIDELAHFVDELRAKGLARTDIDARDLGAAIFATTEGHAIHAALYGAPVAGIVDVLARIIEPRD